MVPEPYNHKDIFGVGGVFPLHKPYPKTAFTGEDSSILGTNEMFCCHLRCERIPRPNEWEKDEAPGKHMVTSTHPKI